MMNRIIKACAKPNKSQACAGGAGPPLLAVYPFNSAAVRLAAETKQNLSLLFYALYTQGFIPLCLACNQI